MSAALAQAVIEEALGNVLRRKMGDTSHLRRAPSTKLAFAKWLATVSPDWDWDAPHLTMIRDHLDAVTRGDSDRLLIVCPPRHGKSAMTTVRYTAWRLECEPTLPVIIAAYNQTLAERFSRHIRRIARDRGLVSTERAASHEWETTAGGGVRAVGVGSGVTGMGGRLIIIDDPVKSREEADSPAYRERLWEWYTDDLFTRREPDAAIVLIQTRWSDDDLAGRILASRDAGRWDVLHLPAIAMTDDPLGREPGEALWPARYPVEALEQIRDVGDEGERGWWALYQGMPKPASGTIVKREWWDGRNRYDIADELEQSRVTDRFLFWDTAEGTGTTNAYTACVVIDVQRKQRRALVRDVWRGRVAFADLLRVIEEQAARWNRDGKLRSCVIEYASSGKAAVQMLRLNAAPWLQSKIVPFPVSTSKDARLTQASVLMQQGRVWLPEPTPALPWLWDFETELYAAPNSAFRDQTDALAEGVLYLRNYLRAPDVPREAHAAD